MCRKWRGGEERERNASMEMYTHCKASGERNLHLCRPLFLKAHGEQRHSVRCGFFIIFLVCSEEPKPPCGTLTRVFILLFPSLFSTPGIISQALHVRSFASFLRNDYLPICYVKSYDAAHNIHILSNGSSWKILVITRPGTFWVNVYHILLSRDE